MFHVFDNSYQPCEHLPECSALLSDVSIITTVMHASSDLV